MDDQEADGASRGGSGRSADNEWFDKVRALNLPREVLEENLAEALCQIDILERQLAAHGPATHKALVDGVNELALLLLARKVSNDDSQGKE